MGAAEGGVVAGLAAGGAAGVTGAGGFWIPSFWRMVLKILISAPFERVGKKGER
jgi:hypothetical protein